MMHITVQINNSTNYKIHQNKVNSICQIIIPSLFKYDEVLLEINFVSKQKIAFLNRQFLNQRGWTDIISFPNDDLPAKLHHIGSLCICPEYLQKYHQTLKEVITHGLLHLSGYDHEQSNSKWQNKLKKLGVKDELSKI